MTTKQELAKQYIELTSGLDSMKKLVKQQITRQINNINPQEDLTQVIETCVESLLPWEDIIRDAAKVYEETFTEEELTGLVSFYGTDTGRSISSKTPVVISEINKSIEKAFSSSSRAMEKLIAAAMGVEMNDKELN